MNGYDILVKVLFCFLFVSPAYASPVRVLPEPVSITPKAGMFTLTKETREWLLTARDCRDKRVVMTVGHVDGVKSAEGYLLDVGVEKIEVRAPTAAGLFYAVQTLRQLQEWNGIPCVHIVDYPRYSYRGMHLDVSRHFFNVAFIKQYLDLLAAYKINTFHWHLTDSHGWRLEIRQYPRLCSMGAWRADRSGVPMTIAEATKPGEPAAYGGYYTQEQVKEIVAYAAERYITVIPEIEMPGHCTAALVAYPQYSDVDNPTPLRMPCGYPGDLQHNFCAGNDSTFIFLQGILKETMALFPSKWIHIGGDEVREGPWLGCSRCRQRMKEKGFTSVRQLQAWFTGRVDSFITASGRRMMGWDEVRNAGLAKGSTIMSWHGDASGRDSSGVEHDVVMTPYRYTYFDFYQSDPGLEPDITYAPLFLDSVYAFNPGDGAGILGGEACLWTENVPTPQRVEYMLLPRMLALSEALWTPVGRRDYTRFTRSVEAQFRRWDVAGIKYAKSIYNPGIHPVYDSAERAIEVKLTSQLPDGELRYRMGENFVKYDGPVKIGRSMKLATAVYRDGQRLGKINTDSFIVHKAMGVAGQLTDGIFGTVEPYDRRWVSFRDSVVMLTLDLGRVQDIRSVGLNCMEDQVSDIFLPQRMAIGWSVDGKDFHSMGEVVNERLPQQLLRHVVHYEKRGVIKARYIQVKLVHSRQLFMDEIVVR